MKRSEFERAQMCYYTWGSDILSYNYHTIGADRSALKITVIIIDDRSYTAALYLCNR